MRHKKLWSKIYLPLSTCTPLASLPPPFSPPPTPPPPLQQSDLFQRCNFILRLSVTGQKHQNNNERLDTLRAPPFSRVLVRSPLLSPRTPPTSPSSSSLIFLLSLWKNIMIIIVFFISAYVEVGGVTGDMGVLIFCWSPTGSTKPHSTDPLPYSPTDTCSIRFSLLIAHSTITLASFGGEKLMEHTWKIELWYEYFLKQARLTFLHNFSSILRWVGMMDSENASLLCLTAEIFGSFWAAACINNNTLTQRLMFADSHFHPLHQHHLNIYKKSAMKFVGPKMTPPLPLDFF